MAVQNSPTPPEKRPPHRWRAALLWLALGGMVPLAITAPLSAQDTGAPATAAPPQPAAPSGRPVVQGPPDGLIPPPQVQPARPVLPILNPAPAPVQSAPAPTRTAPARTTPATPPPVRANAAPARPEPARPAQPVQATPAPSTAPAVPPAPLAVAPAVPVEAEKVPAPTPAPAAPMPSMSPAPEWPEWVPLTAILSLLALVGGVAVRLNRRRKRRTVSNDDSFDETPIAAFDLAPDAAGDAKPAPNSASSAPPPTPAPAPAKPPPASGRAELSIALEPLSATSTLLNFRLRYALTLANHGAVDAADINLRMAVFAGSTANPASINQWFLELPDANDSRIMAIAAGAEQRIEGELAVPMDALSPIAVDGRQIAVPIIAIDARYRHPTGEPPLEAQSAQAFIIGRDAGGAAARLAPLRFDQGPGEFTGIAARDAGLSLRS